MSMRIQTPIPNTIPVEHVLRAYLLSLIRLFSIAIAFAEPGILSKTYWLAVGGCIGNHLQDPVQKVVVVPLRSDDSCSRSL